jgi:cell division inhibitor SulA
MSPEQRNLLAPASPRAQIATMATALRSGAAERFVVDLEKIPAAERAEHYDAIEEWAAAGSMDRPLLVFRAGGPLVYVIQRPAPDRRIR